jgi:exodeoxyribonuclease VII large subunit
MNDSTSPLQVSEVTRVIKSLLSNHPNLKTIWIEGEVTSLSKSMNGHIYFSLKDSGSVLKCALFSQVAKSINTSTLKDGAKVVLMGSINVYEPGGYYNFVVSKLKEFGQGDLFLEIEKLKKELDEKGIFSPDHKKPIPGFIKTLGIATSPHGAAVEDIIKKSRERYPNLNIIIAGCVVQGDEAPLSIVHAIETLNQPELNVDVIIAGRGGGSKEDLMAFNTREVVMAFYNSRIPIISAVGHQIDSVLSDLSADYFTTTPTAAAEFCVPDIFNLEQIIDELDERILNSLSLKIKNLKERWENLRSRPKLQNPKKIIEEKKGMIDSIIQNFYYQGKQRIQNSKISLSKFDHMDQIFRMKISEKNHLFELSKERLEHFSPLLTLKRGYSVTRDNNHKVISSINSVKINDKLEIILSDGLIHCSVETISERQE